MPSDPLRGKFAYERTRTLAATPLRDREEADASPAPLRLQGRVPGAGVGRPWTPPSEGVEQYVRLGFVRFGAMDDAPGTGVGYDVSWVVGRVFSLWACPPSPYWPRRFLPSHPARPSLCHSLMRLFSDNVSHSLLGRPARHTGCGESHGGMDPARVGGSSAVEQACINCRRRYWRAPGTPSRRRRCWRCRRRRRCKGWACRCGPSRWRSRRSR